MDITGWAASSTKRVSERLGIDPVGGQGDWPDGMLSHPGGAKPGGWVVFEVWDSKEAQERFMTERLGQALQEGGINSPPTRMEWLELAGYSTPGS